MTTKTYRSPSNIAINVVLKNGNNFLVSFNSKTIGGSIFTTSNENIQQAIERHYNYNKLFFLERTVITENKTVKKTTVAVNDNEPKDDNPRNGEETGTEKDDNPRNGEETGTEKDDEMTEEDNEEETDATEEDSKSDVISDGMTKVEVTDLVSARDYLNEKFGIKKTTIMSKASIIETAQAHNIVFVGLS